MQSIPYCLKGIFGENRSLRKSLTHLRAATKSSIYLAPSPNLASGPSSREMVPTLKQRYYIYNVNLIFTVTEHQHWLPAPNVSVIYSVPFSSFIPWHIFNITILTMSDGKISGLLPSSFQPIRSMHFIYWDKMEKCYTFFIVSNIVCKFSPVSGDSFSSNPRTTL